MLFKLIPLKKSLIIFIVSVAVYGCGKPGVSHWSEFVSDTTPFVVVPDEGTTINDVLSEPYTPLFDDISPSAIEMISSIRVSEDEPPNLPVEAILLYTDTSNDWQPLWISESRGGLIEYLTNNYQRDFEQNRYSFKSFVVEKLFINDRVIFITEIGDYILFSESSLAVEDAIRTSAGEINPVNLAPDEYVPGSYVVNTSNLERWIHQLSQVNYRPSLLNIFDGSSPLVFRQNNPENADFNWQLSGTMNIETNKSKLIESISAPPEPFILDRFIPVNAAAFSISRLPVIPEISDYEDTYNAELDSYIQQNEHIAHSVSETLSEEFAFAAFAESGAASSSEYLFLRAISNPDALRDHLDELASDDLIIKDDNTYSMQSSILGSLLGSDLNPVMDFYVTVYDEIVALSQRKGLAESIGGDAERRRVMFYDDEYTNIRSSLQDNLSSIHYINAPQFGNFIQPWLYPQNYMGAILSNLDQLVLTTSADPDQSSVRVDITSFQSEETDQPYREQWVFPIGGAELSGKPILANITGSARNEVVFSTENGYVYVLATDGTVVLQLPTNDDQPVGSPVAYDWYGNNQNVIMQAAGDKIYAWNNSGDLLPNFPIVLDETITTPLTVQDINRNGIAEMIVSTADRTTYILNSRGEPINGWPRSTNASVNSSPLIAEINGQRSLFVFSENTLHAWNINGQSREGFPLFLDTQMHGSPTAHNNFLLGSGRDGNLYSIGTEQLFDDTLSNIQSSDSLYIQTISVSNSSLNSTPAVHNILQRNDEGFFSEDLILTQSSNGSLFMHNMEGELRFTHSLGQPSSDNSAPIITDLDNNQRDDIIALADFGRLYAWDLLSGDRLFDLPTTGMQHVIIEDFLGNGQKEIIARTRDGLQSWTIYRTRRGEPDS